MPYPPEWLRRLERDGVRENLTLLVEVNGKRESALPILARTVFDHLADMDKHERVLNREKLAIVMKAHLPVDERTRSGLMGEILASEYIELETSYVIPIKRLRWKDGRETSMRGDDLIGIERHEAGFTILKGETKSRQRLSSSTVKKAKEQLDRDRGRPQQHTMAFIGHRLLEQEGYEEDGLWVLDVLIEGIRDDQLEHCIFTFSGNDPGTALSQVEEGEIPIRLIGLHIEDHPDFILAVFDACHAYLGC